jgi:hypothetical protein
VVPFVRPDLEAIERAIAAAPRPTPNTEEKLLERMRRGHDRVSVYTLDRIACRAGTHYTTLIRAEAS